MNSGKIGANLSITDYRPASAKSNAQEAPCREAVIRNLQ
jgi:hypothetical protein